MARQNAHCLFGSTNTASCVPLNRASFTNSGNVTFSCISSRELTALLQEEYLADIFCVWDCYQNAPTSGLPVLLRFENKDLAVAVNSDGNLIFGVTAIDTSADPALLLGLPVYNQCLAWMPVPNLLWPIGQQVSGVFFDGKGTLMLNLGENILNLQAKNGAVYIYSKRKD